MGARFVVVFVVVDLLYFWGGFRFCTLDADWFAAWWPVLCRWSRVKYSQDVNKQCVLCFPCLALLNVCWDAHHLRTHAPAVVDPPGATYVQIMSTSFSMNTNLKMFCILCLILYCLIILCIILCDTSKASENLTFVLKQSHSVECFCCHHYLLSACHEDQRL